MRETTEARALPLAGLPCIAFDTETTGLDAWDGHCVVQIAWVSFELGSKELPAITSCLVDPHRPVPTQASDVHGWTDARLDDARRAGQLQEMRDVLPVFLAACRGRFVLAYNLRFDAQMLLAAMGRPRPAPDWQPFGLDPMLWARRLLRAPNFRLGTVAAECGVDLTAWHDAGADTCAAALVASSLLPLLESEGIKTLGGAVDLQQTMAREAERSYRRRR